MSRRNRRRTKRRNQPAAPFPGVRVATVVVLLISVVTTTMTTTSSFRLLTGTQHRHRHGMDRHGENRNSLLARGGWGGCSITRNRSRRCLGLEDSATALGAAAFLFPTIPVASSSVSTSLSVFSHNLSIPELLLGLMGVFGVWLYLDGGDDRMRERRRLEQDEAYNKYKLEQYRYCHVEYQEHGWSLDEIAEYKEGTRPKTMLIEDEADDNEALYDNTINSVDTPTDTTNDSHTDTATEYYDGPILLAVDGTVYNVYKGRNFYGPGGEYAIFAGRDATRLLAKGKLDEETTAEQQQPLNIAERAVLATWIYTFQNKYDVVGPLHDYDRAQNSL